MDLMKIKKIATEQGDHIISATDYESGGKIDAEFQTKQLKSIYKTASQWIKDNDVLERAQLGIESDTLAIKIGDGVSTWNTLKYASSPKLLFKPEGQISKPTFIGKQVTSSTNKASIKSTVIDNAHNHNITIQDSFTSTTDKTVNVANASHTHDVSTVTFDTSATTDGKIRLSLFKEFTKVSASNDIISVASNSHVHTYSKAKEITQNALTGITVTSIDSGHAHLVTADGSISDLEFIGSDSSMHI